MIEALTVISLISFSKLAVFSCLAVISFTVSISYLIITHKTILLVLKIHFVELEIRKLVMKQLKNLNQKTNEIFY
jgi:uncharacterized membrane protein YesL